MVEIDFSNLFGLSDSGFLVGHPLYTIDEIVIGFGRALPTPKSHGRQDNIINI
jgi:hypothetical protein